MLHSTESVPRAVWLALILWEFVEEEQVWGVTTVRLWGVGRAGERRQQVEEGSGRLVAKADRIGESRMIVVHVEIGESREKRITCVWRERRRAIPHLV